MEIKSKISKEKMYEILDALTSALILRIIYQEDYMSISAECNIGGTYLQQPDYEVLRDICEYITSKDFEYGRDWEASRLYDFVKNEMKATYKDEYCVSTSFGGLQPALAMLTFLGVYSDIQICEIKFIHSKYEARGHSQHKEHVYVKLNKGEFVIGSFTEDYKFDNSEIPSILDCSLNDVEIGKTYYFGQYHQSFGDSLDLDPIEWIVLNKNKKGVLLLSKKGLDVQPYNSTQEDVTWETCYLREWLNNVFIHTAFSEDEQSLIQVTTVKQNKNTKYNTEGGNATSDKIFLLSVNEFKKYLKDTNIAECQPTNYAIYQTELTDGPSLIAAETCLWWLRTPGMSQSNASHVLYSGELSLLGPITKKNLDCVRPVLWISLK